ncbi:MAG: hypothetical protein U9O82_02925, partial [Thermodesulfobacteriota bacterium]|nr:hypothetical protein [Thermodesulfobacteriota bacterium]
ILSSLCIDVFCTDKQVCPCHPSGSYKKWCKAFLPQIRYNQKNFRLSRPMIRSNSENVSSYVQKPYADRPR